MMELEGCLFKTVGGLVDMPCDEVTEIKEKSFTDVNNVAKKCF